MLAATRPDHIEALRRVAKLSAHQPQHNLMGRLGAVAYRLRGDADAYAAIGRMICAISDAATREHLQRLRNDREFMIRCGLAAAKVEAEVDDRKSWREDREHCDPDLGTY